MKATNLQTRKIRLAGICGMLLAWTACTEEVVIDNSDSKEIPITIKAEISAPGEVTKGDGLAEAWDNGFDRSTFVKGDQIRVERTNVSADFRDYKLGSDGTTWSVLSGSTPLSMRVGAGFRATFPYNYNGILQNQSTAAAYLASNLLKTPVVTTVSGSVVFDSGNAFAHQNTKISLEFHGIGSPDLLTDLTVSGNGLRTGGASAEQMTFFCIDPPTETNRYGIVYPKNTSTDIALSLTYDRVKYTATIKCPMAPGKNYVYTLKIQNDILVPEGMTIKNWNDEDAFIGGFDPIS